MTRRAPKSLGLVHDQQIDAGAHGMLGQRRTLDERFQRDHRTAMQVERIERRPEVSVDVGQPL
jgi:hypothetical protein